MYMWPNVSPTYFSVVCTQNSTKLHTEEIYYFRKPNYAYFYSSFRKKLDLDYIMPLFNDMFYSLVFIYNRKIFHVSVDGFEPATL